MPTHDVVLSEEQRVELSSIVRSRSLPAGYVFRARLLLMLAEGASFSTIKQQLRTTAPTISRWKARFLNSGIDGLDTRHPGQSATVLTAALRARILSATRKKPGDGSTHWSCRKLAAVLGVSKDAVHRTWKEAGLKPHRLERYMASDDPDFESKAADIIGLYMNPPRHAAVFCVDEKTAIQALDRLDPVLPLSPGRAERHGFEYFRHGTLSLYAALDTATGRVHGKTTARHTSRDFVAFLKEVVSLCPRHKQIHIILDNLSAHKTTLVREFLEQNPRVHFHFTPTYSSWLNQIELWFARIERDVIARGIFTSVTDLAHKLRRYINAYSAYARPFQWKYSDPTRRIRNNEITATGHYYLGALRYDYAEWSGDIQTGFQSMQNERMRMLSTLNIGEPHWSMDTGGFMGGQPSPQNYARWMEFAAFVPVDRVHGDFKAKRQPWVYGPKAEAAATRALRLRYELLPYIYSYERVTTETGIGIVRPLFWMFPNDPKVANEGSSWMFGDAFLVSPVVTRGASTQAIYLPAGMWHDYFRGTQFKGGQTISYKVDPQTWQDIPLFVRDGAIIASQPAQDYLDQHPVTEVSLNVFPTRTAAEFTYYDDDGTTYAYEHEAYYRQPIHVLNAGALTKLQFETPTGSFEPALRSCVVRVHGRNAQSVLMAGKPIPKKLTEAQLMETDESGWTNGHDRFGLVTVIRVPARRAVNLVLR